MTGSSLKPTAEGQLVWCQSDPSLGVGLVTGIEFGRVHVRFLRLQEERAYTTRGESQILRYLIDDGERVLHRAQSLQVQSTARLENELAVYILSNGEEVIESELEPEVREVGAKVRLQTLNLVHPQVVRTRLQGLGLSRLWNTAGISASLGARAEWLPHQIDVATRALSTDPIRLLLADEVGLGKTVEAALIYAGLRQTGRADKVLILTPDSLTIQWLGEIYRKAHELIVLLDDDRINDAASAFPGVGPFEGYRRVLMPLSRLVSDPELAEDALATDWDLIIVDEAHHLRRTTSQAAQRASQQSAYDLVEVLARRSRHLLLLTATPMALDPDEYHALLRLLDPVTFDDPKTFAGAHERVSMIRSAAQHLQKALDDTDALEPKLLQSLSALLQDDSEDAALLDAFAATEADDPERKHLGTVVLDALRERHPIASFVVRNRRGPVGGLPERQPNVVMLEPSALQEHLIDVGESVMFELADTIDTEPERYQTLGRTLRALWATPRALLDILRPVAPALTQELEPYVQEVTDAPNDENNLPLGDTRLRWLVSFIRELEAGEKALVFVETDIAVKALMDALQPFLGEDIAMFHRGLQPHDQDRQVAWFRDPHGPSVMLSTEAGGEGRNFQFCHRVILYDMPWRPATVEQRIGRIDRVGQKHDVQVWVPCFKGGFEAAVLKVMQNSIGVLDETVGGIDYELEYVAARLGKLIHTGAGAEAWKKLYTETHTLVTETRQRIANAADPILDHASFSKQRVAKVMQRIPEYLEYEVEQFIRGFAEHNKLELHNRGEVIHVEGAPSSVSSDDDYVATFEREYALDHEDVEFLSFGHPLVRQAMEWARNAEDVSAALALVKGQREGAVFLWTFDLDIPPDLQRLAPFFDRSLMTLALDESGQRQEQFESLLNADSPLQRMDAAPLKAMQKRWAALVEQNFGAAEQQSQGMIQQRRRRAQIDLEQSIRDRRRKIDRTYARRLSQVSDSGQSEALKQAHTTELKALDADEQMLLQGLEKVRPHLVSAVALRITKASSVRG